jgi:hypothetical protein
MILDEQAIAESSHIYAAAPAVAKGLKGYVMALGMILDEQAITESNQIYKAAPAVANERALRYSMLSPTILRLRSYSTSLGFVLENEAIA